MKVITISLSDQCIHIPACSFCFQKEKHSFNDEYRQSDTLRSFIDEKWKNEPVTICFEYSGYNIRAMSHWGFHSSQSVKRKESITYTMTTMPEVVTPIFASYIKSATKIQSIAISYDTEKVKHLSEWQLAAQVLKEEGFQVSCNYLIQNTSDIDTPLSLAKYCNQINLLAMKPTGKYSEIDLKKINVIIEMLKSYGIPVTTDNCLGIQLGYTDKCSRGTDFIHITPDGGIEYCCFESKCFLYEK